MLIVSGILFAQGCGGSTAKQQKVQVTQEDPQGEFEWGIERLERALYEFSPSRAAGLNITERKVKHELFPPTEANPAYTARVSITTETSFLHGRRSGEKDQNPAVVREEPAAIDDPLEDEADEVTEFIDLPGTGPQAPAAASTRIETRTLENETVFDMIYVEGQWKLTQQAELKKHEKLWFKYAFE